MGRERNLGTTKGKQSEFHTQILTAGKRRGGTANSVGESQKGSQADGGQTPSFWKKHNE